MKNGAKDKMPAGKVRSDTRRSSTAIWEAFRIAVDSIWTHKMRSILTLLGVIIGVASVVTVGGAIEGLSSYVSSRLSSVFGSNTFIVDRIARLNASNEEYEKLIKRNKRIYRQDLQAVENQCVGCEAISPAMGGREDIKAGAKTFLDASIVGSSADLPKIQELELAEGSFFTNMDVTHARTIAIIGAQIRNELFETTDALGKQIKLGGENFTVIGVEVQNGNIMGRSLDNRIYIPYTTFLKKYGTRRSIQFRVKAPSKNTLEATADEVRQIMRSRHKLRPNQEDDFDILASSAIQNAVGEFTGAIAKVITPITLISLVVGGIVIMNIMLVTVTERTVEIGTRKAVGAKRSDILLQFLVESALLASIGGFIGVMVSYGLSIIIGKAASIPMRITIGYISMAILASGGIGLISGIYPANKASKLNPIVALTKE